MSFKSIIQDMRSRSHRVVPDSSAVATIDALGQSCWVNLPPALLRDVLIRIDTSEDTWPPRKNVVACAGVCRNWRKIMKEIVKSPEVSGKLTFPISLKQPGPRDSLLQCFIKRNRSSQTYYLYLGLNQASTDEGKFLLAARKRRRPTCTDYIISLNSDDVSKGSSTYVGKLRSNFLCTKFTIFDAQPPHAGVKVTKCRSTRLINRQVTPKVPPGNYSIAHISYELSVLGSRGPRRMHCVMDAIPNSAGPSNVGQPDSPYRSFPSVPWDLSPIPSDASVPSIPSIPSDDGNEREQSVEQPYTSFPSVPRDLSPIPSDASVPSIPSIPSDDGNEREQSVEQPAPEDFRSGHSSVQTEGMLVLRNKAPRWHEQLQCWCLNFNGRVTVASVKNFQLVASTDDGVAGPEHENVILQFGKVGKDVFTMDYQYPISAFQAFAICLSSFETKIACE